MKRLLPAAVLLAAVAQARGKKPPEGLPECSRELREVRRAVLVHLGGCSRPVGRLLHGLDGLGDAAAGWSLVLATDEAVRALRKRGCPTAMVCTSGNELAALRQSLPAEELARKLEEVKARARPKLREGVDGGPLVPWD